MNLMNLQTKIKKLTVYSNSQFSQKPLRFALEITSFNPSPYISANQCITTV